MTFISALKKIKRRAVAYEKERWRYGSKYVIEGEKANKKYLLYVLAGYKEYLWGDVFSRIKDFQIDDLEVCIASSGKYCNELSRICKENGWIYVSTKLNNMCVLTNIILREFNRAEYYFKLDEDIYIPENYFTDMINGYEQIEKKETNYKIGYVCPLLPLGSYSMREYLIEKNEIIDFEKKFGHLYFGGPQVNSSFRENKGIDQFVWNVIKVFDNEAMRIRNKGFSYTLCPIRTGIAAIMFKREFWDQIGSLKRPKGVGWGEQGDEAQLTAFCACNYLVNFRVDNVMVGHFAFGGAEPSVLKLKEQHPEYFTYQK